MDEKKTRSFSMTFNEDFAEELGCVLLKAVTNAVKNDILTPQEINLFDLFISIYRYKLQTINTSDFTGGVS